MTFLMSGDWQATASHTVSNMIAPAIAAFLGALLSLVVAIFIEFQRKPKLCLQIGDSPTDETYPSASARVARFVRVKLWNRAMPRLLRWLGRSAAMQCYGEIQFYHLDDGAPVFARPMPIRWTSSDEPISPHVIEGRVTPLFDPAKYNAAFRRDCFPGTKEAIDVAGRFDEDEECYGWSNETYLPGKGWRNSDWRLPKGRYLVRVTVHSAGEKASGVFKLENSVSRQHFRLLEATKTDIHKLS